MTQQTHKANLIGAVIVSFAFVFVIFAGTAGQLFTLSGKTGHMPAYGTSALPHNPNEYVDPLAYDERGKFIDFKKLGGHTGELSSDTNGCHDQTYVFALKDMKVWKRGSTLDGVMTSLHGQLDPLFALCAPATGMQFACAASCTQKGADDVLAASPLTIDMSAADAVGPGILQYVLMVNGACIRTMHCASQGE